MRRRGLTIIELLIVLGVVAVLASQFFPFFMFRLEEVRLREAEGQLRVLETALEAYRNALGDYPLSHGNGSNPGIETMLAALRSTQGGGLFISESGIARWLGDTDGDGLQEVLDPWQNPWIYFHPADYENEAPIHVINGIRRAAYPAEKGEEFRNPASYQLWTCGQNQGNESGEGDDTGNIRQ